PLALARLLAAILIEDRRRPQLGTRRLAQRGEQLRRGHGFVDDKRQVLPYLRVRAHVFELDRLRGGCDKRIEIELEHTPRSFEEGRVQLANPALLRARRLPRVKVALDGALELRLDLQRVV